MILIQDMLVTEHRYGLVAFFDVRIEDVGLFRGFALARDEERPGAGYVKLPTLKHKNVHSCSFGPDVMVRIATLATEQYQSRTGVGLEYRKGPRPKKVDAEDDAAGLRRVIGETLDRAGI